MTQEFTKLKHSVENVLYVYINTYAALTHWVAENENDLEMVTTFDDKGIEHFPALRAPEVVASQDYLHGAALIHMIMQLGRIADAYLSSLTLRIMPNKPVDDTWFSYDAVEFFTHVLLKDVYRHDALVKLTSLRASVEKVGDVQLSQVQVLQLAKELVQFAEDFDSRFTLEQSTRKGITHNEADNKRTDAPAAGGLGSNSGPAVRPIEPRTSRGPADWSRRTPDGVKYWPFEYPGQEADRDKYSGAQPPDGDEYEPNDYNDPDEDE